MFPPVFVDNDLGIWRKTWENGQCQDESHRLVSTSDNRVVMSLDHFCDETVSANTQKDMEILVYQNPDTISAENRCAYITVYSVPKYIVKVKSYQLSFHPLDVNLYMAYNLCINLYYAI